MKGLNYFKGIESSNRNLVGAIATMLVLAGGCIEPPSGSSVDNHEMGADMKMDMSEDMNSEDMDQEQGTDMGVDMGDLDMGVDLGTDMEADMSEDMQTPDMDQDQGTDMEVDMFVCNEDISLREQVSGIKQLIQTINNRFQVVDMAQDPNNSRLTAVINELPNCDEDFHDYNLIGVDENGDQVSLGGEDKRLYWQMTSCLTECADGTAGCITDEFRYTMKSGPEFFDTFRVLVEQQSQDEYKLSAYSYPLTNSTTTDILYTRATESYNVVLNKQTYKLENLDENGCEEFDQELSTFSSNPSLVGF